MLTLLFFVKGSRGSTLFLLLIISFILSHIYPKNNSKIKNITVFILIFGAIASASISIIRHILVGNSSANSISISELSILETYKQAFSQNENSSGMDLGNAVIGIDVLTNKNDYDYGITYLWDNFIQNNIPRRWVGESTKESLKIKLVDDDKLVDKLTYGITTMTGYYYAYRSFGILAPMLFLLIGLLMGYIWERSKFSMFFLFVYLSMFSQTPLLLTHGPGYIYGSIEFIYIFILPFIYRSFYKVKIK